MGVKQSGFDLSTTPEVLAYEGYPRLVYLGFGIGATDSPAADAVQAFTAGLQHLRQRSEAGLATFIADDIAILGVADGIARLSGQPIPDLDNAREWVKGIADRPPAPAQWSTRMRALAGDLLDGRGRLKVSPDKSSVDALALELAIRDTWPHAFIGVAILDDEQRGKLLQALLTEAAPQVGDSERAVVWLKALDLIIATAAKSLLPTVSDTARILSDVQYSLKRWRWKERSARKNTMPSRWLIDDEYDVQSLLWAVLYPIFRSDLVDETYLPSWGNVQPRTDLGIVKLKLIIEVKIARQPSDFNDIEEQVAGDLGLYFKDTSQYDRMIVFVYDDCDQHRPERYASLKNALMHREHIEDVIIVRRPGMIPNRSARVIANSVQGSAEDSDE
jgi:hypothetical protein